MKKTIIIVIVLAVVDGGIIAARMWFKPHRTAGDEKPAVTLTAEELYTQFEADAAAANAKYLEKVIEVTGTVNSISKTELGDTKIALATSGMLAEIACIMEKGKEIPEIASGTEVAIKGICIGYNTDVELKQGVLTKP